MSTSLQQHVRTIILPLLPHASSCCWVGVDVLDVIVWLHVVPVVHVSSNLPQHGSLLEEAEMIEFEGMVDDGE